MVTFSIDFRKIFYRYRKERMLCAKLMADAGGTEKRRILLEPYARGGSNADRYGESVLLAQKRLSGLFFTTGYRRF